MANFNDIKHEIDQNVNTNGQQAITGAILNETLKDMIDEVDAKKQDTLVAGQNITISGNVISATGGGGGQTLTPGSSMTIDGNDVINLNPVNVAGNGLNGAYEYGTNPILEVDVNGLAGNGLTNDGTGKFAIDSNVVASQSDLSGLQPALTAGDGIEIDANNEISVKAGTGLSFDSNGYLVNTGGGGGSQTLVAGDGIEIDQNDAINAKLGNGLQLDGSNNIEIDPSVVATQSDLGNYLGLSGGTLQAFVIGEDTELKVLDTYGEDYVDIVAPDTPGEKPHIEIFENGSGDTKIYYDHIERGSQVSIDLPSSSGTLALTSDIPSYTAGNGIDITDLANNIISVDSSQLAGGGLAGNYNGQIYVNCGAGLKVDSGTAALEPDYQYIQEKLTAGNGIEIDANNEITVKAGSGLGFDINGYLINTGGSGQSYVAGSGIDITGNTISVDNTVATTSDLSGYLPLTGGNLQASNIATEVRVKSPSDDSYVYLHAVDTGSPTIKFHRDIQNPTNGEVHEITLHDERLDIERWDQTGNTWMADTLYFPQFKTGTIALDTDLQGKQDTLTAGSGITIQNNVISATGGGGSGLWTSGTGTGSVMSPGATQANGNYSVSGGDGTKANGTGSVSLGGNTTASGIYSTALGAGSSATNSYTVAIGHGVQAANQNETALGAFNLYTNSGTSAQKTFFTVGNGTGTNAKSNLIEAKENNDIYVVGVGNYDGTNAGSSGVQTLQDAIANAGGGGGGGLWVNGTGTNSLMAPGTAASANTTSSGVGSLNAGIDDTDHTRSSLTSGDYSANFGLANWVQGDYSGAVGKGNQTIGDASFAIGKGNIATGRGSFAGGYGDNINGQPEAKGEGDFAFNGITNGGNYNIAINGTMSGTGSGNFALGGEVGGLSTNPAYSVSIGQINGDNSKSATRASHSIALGGSTYGEHSVSIGPGTATNNDYEVAIGPYNKSYLSNDNAVRTTFSVGNGEYVLGGSTFKNALEVKKNNDAYLVGVGGYTGTNGGSAGVSSLQTVINGKQEALVSGTNIKTVNGNSLLGSGNLVISGGSSLSAGDGIDIDSNDAINVKLGNGLQLDGSNNIEVDTSALSSSFLPLTGGTLQQTNGDPETLLSVISDDSSHEASVYASDTNANVGLFNYPSNPQEGDIDNISFVSDGTITIADYIEDPQNPGSLILDTKTLQLPAKNDTIATLDDIPSASSLAGDGLQDDGNGALEVKAGSGLGFDINGYLVNSSPSLFTGSTNTARTYGNNSATGTYSFALGNTSNASGESSVSLGDHTISQNKAEISLGRYNKSVNSGTNAELTKFSIGSGSANNNRRNSFEIKFNNDAYLVGVGGYDGANAGQSGVETLQTVLSGKQDTLVSGTNIKTVNGNSLLGSGNILISGGGGGLWVNGTGTDSLVAPGTVNSTLSQDPAAGDGAISCGYDTNADGDFAFAQGGQSSAAGDYSFAGNNSTANGEYSAAFNGSGAYGFNSFAAINGTANADYSIALGGTVVSDDSDPDNPIDAQFGVAIGDGSTVNGQYGVAIAGGTAYGEGSVAIGSGSEAYGLYDVAVAAGGSKGNYSFAASSGQTDPLGHYASGLSGGYAAGESSLASGMNTSSWGFSSVALGLGITTYDQVDGNDPVDANAGEVALGRYNYSERDIIFTIGCGYLDTETDEPVPENAVAIDTSGNIFIKGIGGYTGQSISGCTSLQDFLNNL